MPLIVMTPPGGLASAPGFGGLLVLLGSLPVAAEAGEGVAAGGGVSDEATAREEGVAGVLRGSGEREETFDAGGSEGGGVGAAAVAAAGTVGVSGGATEIPVGGGSGGTVGGGDSTVLRGSWLRGLRVPDPLFFGFFSCSVS
jgi:hypothetical protein